MNRSTKRQAKKAGMPETIVLVNEQTKAVTELMAIWSPEGQLVIVFVEGERVIYKADALDLIAKLASLTQKRYDKLREQLNDK